uniref:BED-type domain-containing protein n=1 Tax=Scleropages formosus TaxID=113540 RepID=A0A8C9RJF4_SCLFO
MYRGNGTEQVQLKREMDRSGTANGVHNGAPCSSLMKPRKQSTLWEFYQDGHDGSEALCLLCSDTVLYQHDTRHLLTHLQKRHPVEFSNLDNEAATEQSSGPMRDPGEKALEQEARMLERERELTAQLRRAQEQEARALERERELTEQLRKARDQERKAAQEQEDRALEREHKLMEQLRREHEQEMRRVQELEARVLERERRAIEQLGMALEQEARAIQREREALEQLRRELEQDRRALQRQREEVGRSTDASDANLDVQHHEEQSV